MCGICQCAPDFFGRKCECDAENLSFHGDLGTVSHKKSVITIFADKLYNLKEKENAYLFF